MKKLSIFLWLLLSFVITIKAQPPDRIFFIKGQVLNRANGLPIPNHQVTIMSDSMQNPYFFHYKSLTTSKEGYFIDSIAMPGTIKQLTFNIWTIDCNNNYVSQTLNYAGQASLAAIFKICESGEFCKAFFYSYRDSTISSSRYAYKFYNKSEGNNMTYNWDFGDNTTSTEVNPMHKYDQPGKFNVCLTMTSTSPNGITCTNTYCQTIYNEDYPPVKCYAGFYYYNSWNGNDSTVYPVKDGTFYFVDNSFGGNNPIVQWYWNFGDGSTSFEQNPIHSFKEGVYKVCLTIKSGLDSMNLCTDTYCQTIQLGNINKCYADFFSVNDSLDNLTMKFYDLSSATINNWFWDFGDGNKSNEKNPIHKYLKPGSYYVCLSAYNDSLQCKDSRCYYIYVGQPEVFCNSSFTYFSKDSVNFPTNIFSFINNSKGNFTKTNWDFGDGTYSNEFNPYHKYIKPGTYNVCLTISGSSDSTNPGCYNTYCETIYVGGIVDICKSDFIAYLDSSVNTPNFYLFTDISSGNPTKWYWDFGDGAVSNDQNPTHQYLKEGSYKVCLTIVNDSLNCKDSFCHNLFVGVVPSQCDVRFKFYPDSTGISIPEAKPYMFYAEAKGNIIEYNWTFDDGSFSNEAYPVHSFYPGVHSVCLDVVIADAYTYCKAHYCEKIIVGNTPPPPPHDNCYNYFTYNFVNNANNEFNVNFNAYTYNKGNLTYIWDFGDGLTETTFANQISHIYKNRNAYKACLTTISKDSILACTYSSCQDIFPKQDTTYSLGYISGTIFAANDFADKGYVTIVKIDNQASGNILYFDVAQIDSKGYYHFDNIPYGGYYVLANLYADSKYYSSFIPTYYGDSWNWNSAKMVGVGDFAPTDNININLLKVKGHIKGNCNISGYIKDHSGVKSNKNLASSIEVLLLDSYDNIIALSYTDNTGLYKFQNIDYGSYKIYVEVLGLQTTPAFINLDQNNKDLSNIDFIIDLLRVSPFANAVGINSVTTSENIIGKVYPNPASTNINVNLQLIGKSSIQIQIFNLTGQIVNATSYELNKGESTLNINTENLKQGIYYLKISDKLFNINSTNKFLKIN